MCSIGGEHDTSEEVSVLTFFVNGKKVVESFPDPSCTLLYYLRRNLGLCGTKEGCGVGGGGACTVMVSRINRRTLNVQHIAVNACITPLCSLHGTAITTVEGIGSTKTELHPIQERLAKSHGSQCGFCTPGFVMSMYALLRSKPKLTLENIEEAFQGNLCRCTGYRPILAGLGSFAAEWENKRIVRSVNDDVTNGCSVDNNSSLENGCALKNGCCKKNSNKNENKLVDNTNFEPYDHTQETISPPESVLTSRLDKRIMKSVNGQINGCALENDCVVENGSSLQNAYCRNIPIRSKNEYRVVDTSKFNPYDQTQEPISHSDLVRSSGIDKRIKHSLKNTINGCVLENCCALKNGGCKNKYSETESMLIDNSKFRPYDQSQEPIFPPELVLSSQFDNQKLRFIKNGITWIRPITLKQLLSIKSQHPECKLVAGNTEIGVETKFGKPYPLLVHISMVIGLNTIEKHDDHILVGGSVTLSELQSYLNSEVRAFPLYQTEVLAALYEILYWFAGKQVRNVATLAGNIVTASPISDLSPLFLATGVYLNLAQDREKTRRIKIDENFFVGYRKNVIQPKEVIVSFEIPLSEKNQHVRVYKQARRREDDISIVTAAFNVFLDDNAIIKDIKMAFGGMDKITRLAHITSQSLIGSSWDEDMLERGIKNFIQEFDLCPSTPGGMADYRMTLCPSLFIKFYASTNQWKSMKEIPTTNNNFKSALTVFNLQPPKASQYFEIKSKNKSIFDSVGKPVPHASALKQSTGEAIFADDIPLVHGELFAAFVLSQRAHAKIISIHTHDALKQEGVVAFYSINDIDISKNTFGIGDDEKVFADGIVRSYAEVIGIVIAEDLSKARNAAKMIKVVYEDLPYILTLEEAIEQKSFFPDCPVVLRKGDTTKALNESKYVINGSSRSGAQEHFYLECYTALIHPREDELYIISSSQYPGECEKISTMLGIPRHKIISKTKRIGGGFGGKESRVSNFLLPIAFAANKLNKPIRCYLDRAEDMQFTGTRNPFLINYRVGFNENGKILAAEFDMYNNGGSTLDYSILVMRKAMVSVDNAYYMPNITIKGYACKTNLPSNTAFRGFGAPQAMFSIEKMIRHIARTLKKNYIEIAEINMYERNQLTHINQLLQHCTMRRCWDECMLQAKYYEKIKQVEQFNRKNRWKKKGLSIVPTKFPISFDVDCLMQGSAYVLMYTDGTLLITIGGVEMGQGLYTKMIQVASRALDLDISQIHISETSTDKTANQGPTAASLSSDLYGMAVVDACTKLATRIKPFKEKNPDGQWKDWATAAWLNQVSLGAAGHYKATPITYDMEKNEGLYAEYYTYGVAVTEVIIDCLTGDHQVLSADIVMDLGESLNPAIDIGQIEGAFMQGYGLFVMEESMVSPSGKLISNGPGNYKIPALGDIPREFNVSLLKGAPNPHAVYASKAVGEPPLFLAASVFFALEEAIQSARIEAGFKPEYNLTAPLTCAKIRMACADRITEMVNEKMKKKDGQPWFVVA